MENNKYTDGKSPDELKIMADTTISHLRNVSNQEVLVPVIGLQKSLKIEELIPEVEKLTPLGITFMNELHENLSIIEKTARNKS